MKRHDHLISQPLSRSVADMGFFEFRRQLEYKTAPRGCRSTLNTRSFRFFIVSHKFNDKTLCWLYKFHSLDGKELGHVERIFTHGELHFSPISAFNDPFDCRPRYEFKGSKEELRAFAQDFFGRKMPLLQGGALEEKIKSTVEFLSKPENIQKTMPATEALLRGELNKIGVCCFSEDWSDVLMWAHYAAKHSGICLRFKATADTPFFSRAQRVLYRLKYPVRNPVQQSARKNLENTVYYKGKFWRHEKEWRIIEHEAGPGEQFFPLHLLDLVILGMNISAPHQQLVRAWADQLQHKPPVVKVAPTENSYGLRLV